MTFESISQEVVKERARQDIKWGGEEHDDSLPIDTWHNLISDYNGWARRLCHMGSLEKARKRYIQTAALSIAVVESMDRVLKTIEEAE